MFSGGVARWAESNSVINGWSRPSKSGLFSALAASRSVVNRVTIEYFKDAVGGFAQFHAARWQCRLQKGAKGAEPSGYVSKRQVVVETEHDPWHYVPVLARKPGALRNGAPFKDWVLPTAMERVRRKLASVDDGNRQMVDILTAVLTDGLPAVDAACAEAIAHGVHSADIVLNILARQRDPGPPATIFTPAALTLRHAPIADCARYDNLRRTI